VFEGSNQASLIARILDFDPPALHTLAPVAPAALSHVVQGCLEKDPKERWQSAHDVHRQLDWIRLSAASAPAGIVSGVGWTRWIPWAVLAIGLLVAGSPWLLPPDASAPSARRLQFRVELGDARLETLDVPELSPDGTRLAYTAVQRGTRRLFVHDLQTQVAASLPGTTGAAFPFWAPDGQSIAYFAQGALRRVSATGGASRTLAPAAMGTGGAWAADTILFAPTRPGALHRMGMEENQATPVRTASEGDPGAGSPGFVLPSFLPDGDRYFTVSLANTRGVYFGSLRDGWLHHLMEVPSFWVRYSAGHLLYVQGRRLVGRPLDLPTARFVGQERTIAEAAGAFSVLPDGTIAYREPEAPRQLTWVDRNGAGSAPLGDPDDYIGIALAPRGRRAAVWRSDESGNVDLWEVDTATGILSRLTSHPSLDADAAWSPDERRLAFTSSRGGINGVYVRDLESGKESALHAGPDAMHVDGWTPDGTHVVARTAGREVFVVPVIGDARPRMVADTPYAEDETHVSSDGRWISFNSNESGTFEVYVAAFPSFTSKRQLSKGGGVQPLWRGDGRELFYLAPDGAMMSVAIDTSKGFAAAAPRRLFPTNVEPSYQIPQYAVTADGNRFLLLDRGPSRPDTVHVLLNWLTAPVP
jgi:Tol biopolymer transport system component